MAQNARLLSGNWTGLISYSGLLILVPGVPPFGLEYRVDPVIHGLDQVINIILRNSLLGLYYDLNQFIIGAL